ncbi:MAG: class I SAM-dependent methyltransferase [Candidatus Paceibacterota bacterium]
MSKSLGKIYEDHHQASRDRGFSIFAEERGNLLKKNIGKGKNVMDIGCRDGALAKYFFQENNVLGVDIDGSALNRAKESLGIETIIADLNGDWHELGERKFDVIVAGEVLEHLYFPEKVLEKVSSHLNNKGIFLGSVPNAFSLKNRIRYLFAKKENTPLGDPTHINHFSYKELKNLLQKYFSEVEIIGLGRFKFLSKLMPGWFAFSLFFKAK